MELVMRKSDEIERLIYQSVKESDLFDGEWESMFYSNLLEMIITKGGGVDEFLEHFSPYFDLMDLDWYYKDDLVKMYGDDGYQLFVDLIIRGYDE
jgi:hypothetical protein